MISKNSFKGNLPLHNILAITITLCTLLDLANCQTCALTGLGPAEPNIPLQYCTMYQNNACCNSLQDQQIKALTQAYFSSRCQGRYPSLKQYFCFGCSPDQPTYTSTNAQGKQVLKVCSTFFSSKVWGAPLDEKTVKYDPCGLQITINGQQQIITASTQYSSAKDFANNNQPIFLSDFLIEFDDKNCLKGSILKINSLNTFIVLAIYFLISILFI
ncbi:hypothetical protein ABPG72_014263 [Tetrahymena utriculariae]